MRSFIAAMCMGAFPLVLSAAEAEKDMAKPAEAADKKEKDAKDAKSGEPVVRQSTVKIDGKSIPYEVTTGKLLLKDDADKGRASIFYVSYRRTDVGNVQDRPVMFAFNGGPGSSAVWLHIGVLGPKIVKLPGDGTTAPVPPVRIVDNPLSILDVCDLVFVDPVSTGYSRVEKDVKADDFHGLDGDIESIGDFVRLWISQNKRWASPKFLLGESYGGIRVAGLSEHLQSRYGMSLNGIVLLSSLLDFATLGSAQGNDLTYQVYLPSYTGVAHFHQKIQGDRDALVKESSEFAFGEYASALLKGTDLDEASRTKIAEKLAALTGISAATWIEHDLRINYGFFRTELLRKERKIVGRFDARVAWDNTDHTDHDPEYDPSFSLAYGAFSTAMLDYLGTDLEYKEDRPYEILTGKVRPWRWNSENKVVNLTNRLATAMRDNPHLKVLVMGGRTDLATPPEGVAHSMRHMLSLSPQLRKNISTTYYDGGHMFYLNPPDLEKSRKDLVKFIQGN